MANVLVLQELTQNVEHIKTALEPRGHRLTFVNEPEMAMRVLNGADKIDAIICAVYLEESDVFEFVRKVKRSQIAKNVPVVFYCYKTSSFARSVRSALKIAAKSTGVDLYITMESFVAAEFAEQFEQFLNLKSVKSEALKSAT